MASVERFEFAFQSSYRPLARLFGIPEERAWVEVSDTHFEARYGHWHVRTPLSNIVGAAVTGPYRYLKTAGPARLAFTDVGMTFASNGKRGVRVSFREPVPGWDPFGLLKHPELTVTVTDVDRLEQVLRDRARLPRRGEEARP